MGAVKTEKQASNFVITFNRPAIRSPLSVAVLLELDKQIAKAEKDKSIETIIFTGVADVFASGADLREIAALDETNAKEFALRGQNLMRKIADSKKKTVAAINGFCYGGALDLALACKTRIAAPTAKFSHPGVRLGIITGWGGTQRLPRLIGEAKALEMFLTAKILSAVEALKCGLIDEINDDPFEAAAGFEK